jgi:hypothetical protein
MDALCLLATMLYALVWYGCYRLLVKHPADILALLTGSHWPPVGRTGLSGREGTEHPGIIGFGSHSRRRVPRTPSRTAGLHQH